MKKSYICNVKMKIFGFRHYVVTDKGGKITLSLDSQHKGI